MGERISKQARIAALSSAYDRWRDSQLGRITDALERDLILALVGPVDERRVLDVGCGDGDLALALVQAGATVTGIDADPRMLDAARRRFEMAGVDVRLVRSDVLSLPFEDACFDAVTAVTVLCFVHEADRAVAEMTRVLKPGGRLVIGELGRWSFWAAWRRLRASLGNATWRAARFRSARELRVLATQAGLVVETIRAAIFYPPVGWLAAFAAPFDQWLGRRVVFGGAFLALAADKSCDEQHEIDPDERRPGPTDSGQQALRCAVGVQA